MSVRNGSRAACSPIAVALDPTIATHERGLRILVSNGFCSGASAFLRLPGSWFSTPPLTGIRRMQAVDGRISGLTLLLSLILSGGVAFAQISEISHSEASRASIEGVVKLADQQNQTEPVPGVPVTLTSSSAGESLAATTDAEGRYQFKDLSPGTYAIQARLQGFQPFGDTVVLRDGETKIQDVGLELEKVVESIEVQDQAATVPTESAVSRRCSHPSTFCLSV